MMSERPMPAVPQDLTPADESYDNFLADGKPDINALLWKFAPRTATLGELDDLALLIYSRIERLHTSGTSHAN